MNKGEPHHPADETVQVSMPSFSQLQPGSLAIQGGASAPRPKRDRMRSRPIHQNISKVSPELTTLEAFSAMTHLETQFRDHLSEGDTAQALAVLVHRFESASTALRSRVDSDWGEDCYSQVLAHFQSREAWAVSFYTFYRSLLSFYKKIDSNDKVKSYLNLQSPTLLASLKVFLKDFRQCFPRSSSSSGVIDTNKQGTAVAVANVFQSDTERVVPPVDSEVYQQKPTVRKSPHFSHGPRTADEQYTFYSQLLSHYGYECQGVLGQGAMGIVLKAHKATLDRDVAVKVCISSSEEDDLERLRREGKAMVQLSKEKQEAVTPVYDLIELPSGEVLIIMGLEEGPSIALDRYYDELNYSQKSQESGNSAAAHLRGAWVALKHCLFPNDGVLGSRVSMGVIRTVLHEATEKSGLLYPYIKSADLSQVLEYLDQNIASDSETYTGQELHETSLPHLYSSVLKPALIELNAVSKLDQGVFDGAKWKNADRYLRRTAGRHFPTAIHDEIFLLFAQSLISDAAFINRSGYLHRDHKPQNFILTKEAADVYIDLINESTRIAHEVPALERAAEYESAFNLALDQFRAVKKLTRIMDYGLIKDLSELESGGERVDPPQEGEEAGLSPQLTQQGAIMGTTLYMTVNTVYSLPSRYADIHAICVSLVEIYTGDLNPLQLTTTTHISVMTSLGQLGADVRQELDAGVEYIPQVVNPIRSKLESLLPMIFKTSVAPRNSLSVADRSDAFFNHWKDSNPRVLRMFRALSRIHDNDPEDDTFLRAWDFAESELNEIVAEPIPRKVKIGVGVVSGVILTAFLALFARTPDKVALAEFEKEKAAISKKADELEKNLSAEEIAHEKEVAEKKAELAALAKEAERIKAEKNSAERKRQIEDFSKEFEALQKLYFTRKVLPFRKEYEKLQSKYVLLGGSAQSFVDITKPMRSEMFNEGTLSNISYESLKFLRKDKEAALQLLRTKNFDQFCKQARSAMDTQELQKLKPSDFEILLSAASSIVTDQGKWAERFDVRMYSAQEKIDRMTSSVEYQLMCRIVQLMSTRSNHQDTLSFERYSALVKTVKSFYLGIDDVVRNILRDKRADKSFKSECSKLSDKYYNHLKSLRSESADYFDSLKLKVSQSLR